MLIGLAIGPVVLGAVCLSSEPPVVGCDDDVDEEVVVKIDEDRTTDELIDAIQDEIRTDDPERIPELVAITGTLAKRYPDLERAERSKIRKLFGKVWSLRKDEWNCDVCIAVLEGYGQMGSDGEKAVLRVLKDKKRMYQTQLLSAALVSLGQHENPRNIDRISRGLFHENVDVVAAACSAMGQLQYAKDKDRKRAVALLIRGYGAAGRSIPSAITGFVFPGAPSDPDRLEELLPHYHEALLALTSAGIGREQWESWWSDNKHKKWPDRKRPEKEEQHQ